MRGQAADYDHWRQLGNAGWGWDDVLPYFKRSEDHYRGADECHGAGGEWRIEQPRVSLGDPGRVPRRGGRECGIPQDRRLQPRRQRGLRLFPGQPAARHALDHGRGFLKPALSRPNLRLHHRRAWSSACASRRPRARASSSARTASQRTRHGARRGDPAAGAIGSPQLLQLSGIGRRRSCCELGIAVRARCCRASARTCRTICSCGWSTRSRACAR